MVETGPLVSPREASSEGLGRRLSVAAAGLRPTAAEPMLQVEAGGETRSFSRDEMLARPDAATVEVPKDSDLWRADDLPRRSRCGAAQGPQLPAGQRHRGGGAGWLCRADPARSPAQHRCRPSRSPGSRSSPPTKPWPKIRGKDYTAGPFYIVWTKPGGERHPKRILGLSDGEAGRASNRPPRAGRRSRSTPACRLTIRSAPGQTLFVAQCMPCHKLSGAGASDVGPDLNRPMNPTEYMTPGGLHALIRDPKSVRTWPEQRMSGFRRPFERRRDRRDHRLSEAHGRAEGRAMSPRVKTRSPSSSISGAYQSATNASVSGV